MTATNQARAATAPPAGISAAPSCQGARGPIPATAGDPSRRIPGLIVDEQCVVVSSLNLAAPARSGAAFFGGMA
jgi:hypothetical protein